ncbi:MAG TPA: class I SAM-dependent methyltransferase [bacterium]|nr:class I SAM-dependent methyltransferase [bacterium]
MTDHHSRARELPHALLPAPEATVPALVLKVGRYVLHDHGGLGVIRTLGRLGVPVYGIVEDRFTPAAVSGYLTGAFVWDTRDLDRHRLLDGMAVIAERLDRPTVLIPTDDAAAIFMAEEAATLRRWYLFPEQPAHLPRTLASKKELYLLCKRIGVACPETVIPNSLSDVHRFVESAMFPVMVKAAERHPRSERTTWIARTPEQAVAVYRDAEGRGGSSLIFQEYIPPACGEDWFYHGYRNTQSDCCVGFTGRKLRSYPPFAGPTTLGQAVGNEPLRQQVEALLQAVSYSGVMDLDYRLDKRDGRYKLLDFNPRIGAQFRLFESPAGLDVARALYLDLTGRRVPRPGPIEGRTFIVEPYDLLASLGYFRRGVLGLREWWRSLEGWRELAWFNRDDVLPFLVMGLRLFLRGVERALRMRPGPPISNRLPSYVRGARDRVAAGPRTAVRARRIGWLSRPGGPAGRAGVAGTEVRDGGGDGGGSDAPNAGRRKSMRGTLRAMRTVSRLARLVATDPSESWGKIQDHVAEWRERRRPRCGYEVERDWERRLHQLLGLPGPGEADPEFWALWPQVVAPFEAQGVQIGRGAFGGWGDGEPGMVRAVWYVVRHLRPACIVETGVARGFTTRVILEALERNGSGHLWSIDLPPALKPELHRQVGAAVLDRLRHRWSYLKGSSAQRLPGLLARLGQIDLFIHDSRHTERTVRFELDRAWAALRPGGVLIVDDIDLNRGFASFTRAFSGHQSLVCYAEPLRPDPPRFHGRGLFGIIRKNVAAADRVAGDD